MAVATVQRRDVAEEIEEKHLVDCIFKIKKKSIQKIATSLTQMIFAGYSLCTGYTQQTRLAISPAQPSKSSTILDRVKKFVRIFLTYEMKINTFYMQVF